MQQTFSAVRGVALAALVVLSAAACEQDPFSATDIGDPSFAKGGPNAPPTNGGRIYFASSMTGNYDIYSVNHDGSDLRRLTFSTDNEYAPAVSPDGRKVAYLRRSGQRADIWIMDADGGRQKQRLAQPADAASMYFPSWSPDGKLITFSYQENGTLEVRIATMSASNGEPTVLPIAGRFPSWSPDGQFLAYAAVVPGEGTQLVTSRPDGSDFQQRTSNAVSCCGLPQWSPDGSSILYTIYENGETKLRLAGVGVSGSAINVNHVPEGPAAWSPDGTRIVYTPLFGTGLRVVYLSGGEGAQIANGVHATGALGWSR